MFHGIENNRKIITKRSLKEFLESVGLEDYSILEFAEKRLIISKNIF